MNKISKKIVSLVTMAAFALTLVPAAAFGADFTTGTADQTASVELQGGKDKTVVLEAGQNTFTADVTTGSAWTAVPSGQVVFWLEQNGEVKDIAEFTSSKVSQNVLHNQSAPWTGVWAITTNITDGDDFDVTGTVDLDATPGVYELYSGIYQDGDQNIADLTDTEQIGTITVNTPLSAVSNLTSSFYTVDEKVTTDKNVPVPVEFNFRNSGNILLNGVDLGTTGIAVWATEDNVVTDALQVVSGDPASDVGKLNTTGQLARVYKLTNTVDLDTLAVKFTRTGTYTLHAALIPAGFNATSGEVADLVDQFRYKADQQVVEVVADAAAIKTVTLSGGKVTGADKDWNATLTKANGAETNTHTVTVLDADNVPVEGATFTVSANSTNVNLSGTSFTTDENGEFEFTYSAKGDDYYKIYIKNAQYGTITLDVTAGQPEAVTADTIVANEKDVVLDATQASSLENVVTFTITDTKGNVLTGDNGKIDSMMAAEPAVVGGDADYIKLLDKPDKFRGKATNFKLDYVDNAYTLVYNGSPALVAGDYTVEIKLDNGNSCQATFSLGDFNASAIESLQVVPTSDTVEFNKTDAPTVTYDVLAVDANGVSSDITNTLDWTLGLDFASGINVTPGAKGSLTVDFSKVDNKEDVLGTEITITAASSEYGIAQGKVTVVDAGVVDSIEFDSTEGEVNKDNKVKASAVDADGNVLKNVEGKVFAYVADQSNQDAVVEVTPGQNAVDGVATITIFSDKETTVDVVVGIQKDKDNSPIYAGTLTYTIGAADVNADTLLGMTIGSTDYIVNNDVISGDAAPYIDENWRTMVPVRVLNETFGGTVDFKDNVITIVNGDTTVVMTIGEETYTVNDEEKTMDTAPVIRDNDRAYVPVRFMAEALGYTVTPLQAADGTTAGVVFQK